MQGCDRTYSIVQSDANWATTEVLAVQLLHGPISVLLREILKDSAEKSQYMDNATGDGK